MSDTDIVDRLRVKEPGHFILRNEAAEEIERLREALAEITDLTLNADERRSIAVMALGWDKF